MDVTISKVGGWCIVALISAAFFCEDTLVTMLIPILPSISIQHDSSSWWSASHENTSLAPHCNSNNNSSHSNHSQTCQLHYSQLGILFGLQGLVQLIFNPISGFFIDCSRSVFAMLVGYVLNIFSCFVFSFAHDFYSLIVAVCLNSLGGSFHICGSIAFLAEVFSRPSQRRKYIGMIHVFLFIGSSVGPFYGGFLFQYMGQVLPFLLLAPVFLVCTVSFAAHSLYHCVRARRGRSNHNVADAPHPTVRWKASIDEMVCSSLLAHSKLSLNSRNLDSTVDQQLQNYTEKWKGAMLEPEEQHLSTYDLQVATPDVVIVNDAVTNINNKSASPARSSQKPTPLWKLLTDPYILVCAGGLSVVHVGSLTLGPTLSLWMKQQYECNETEQGAVWLSGLVLHPLGTLLGAWSCNKFPQKRAIFSMIAICLSGIGSLVVPFIPRWYFITLPVALQFFCIGFIEVVLIPFLTQIVDKRHTPVYGSISAIAFGSYSLTACVCGFIAGPIAELCGFLLLNVGVFALTCLYAPVLLFTRKY